MKKSEKVLRDGHAIELISLAIMSRDPEIDFAKFFASHDVQADTSDPRQLYELLDSEWMLRYDLVDHHSREHSEISSPLFHVTAVHPKIGFEPWSQAKRLFKEHMSKRFFTALTGAVEQLAKLFKAEQPAVLDQPNQPGQALDPGSKSQPQPRRLPRNNFNI